MRFDDTRFLELIDGSERLLAKVLGLILLVVMAVATVQLVIHLFWSVSNPQTPWLGDQLIRVLGDVLNILIALEVLQNVTAYLRRHVVQIELVLITAMTAVARKVIVLPQGSEHKPELLIGLGVAVASLAAAFWLVRSVNQRRPLARTGPARLSRAQDR